MARFTALEILSQPRKLQCNSMAHKGWDFCLLTCPDQVLGCTSPIAAGILPY